jgi:Flp pilus assembly protein TadD
MPVPALSRDRLLALAAAGACLLTAGWLALHARDESALRAANTLGLHGHYAAAAARARTVHRAPAEGRALRVQAYAAAATGHLRDAAALFARAAARDPRDWELQRDWARTLLAAGRREAAARHMAAALALNPRMALPPGFVGN